MATPTTTTVRCRTGSAESEQARDRLRALLAPGDTVYTALTHVSRSGMQRRIRAFVVADGKPWDVSGMVARALGRGYAASFPEGVVVGGVGMDMGFELVYSLACSLADTRPGATGLWAATASGTDHGYQLTHRWL